MVALVGLIAPGTILGGAGALSIGGIALTTAAGGLTLAGGVLNLAGSLLLSTALSGVRRPRPQDQTRALNDPASLVVKRFPYGQTRTTGTRIALSIKGAEMVVGYLLSSRPSEGEFSLFLDKRRVELEGDPFDFSGPGATAAEEPFSDHMRVWIGRGDQVAPPDDLLALVPWSAEKDDWLKSTDVGQGCTVLWLQLSAGDSGVRHTRWPSFPPNVEVEGKWSRVWDMRDPAQDPNDSATWAYSNNFALCVLDFLRTNPMRPYQLRNLLTDQWQAAADRCDEVVSLKSGGTEPRYRLQGTAVFDGGEVEDMLKPMMDAAAANFVRSAGMLGLRVGVWEPPQHTLTDLLESMSCQTLKPGEDLPTQVKVKYTSPARQYEEAELTPWDIPGAQEADGGDPKVVEYQLHWCGSPQQAMRVRNIKGLRARRQKSLGGTAPPSAVEAEAGDNITAAFPPPFESRNGVYEVQTVHPALDTIGAGGVALRCPVSLIENGPGVYAWNPATDEEDIEDPVYDGTRTGTQAPGAVSVTSGDGVDLDTGGSIIPRFRYAFAPSPSSSRTGYLWEWRLNGQPWEAGGQINHDASDAAADDILDGDGKVFLFLPAASVTHMHDFRVRAIGSAGASGWSELTGAIYDFSLSSVSVTAQTGAAEFAGTTPANTILQGVQVYSGTTDDFTASTPLGALQSVTAGSAFLFTIDTLSAGPAYFWAVPVTLTGSEGTADGPHLTTIL